jgi:integrase/recombinase XerD
MGKGNKIRHLQLGEAASRAVRRLIGEYRDPRHPERPAEKGQPVFTSRRGKTTGAALTRFGLYRIIRTLGEAAGVEEARCSPHTFRHSFAVSYLRHGGTAFSLQTQLGHEALDMTRKYVNLAQADLANEHARASPADNMFGRKRKR